MITNNQLSDEEKNKLESRLFEIFLEALRKVRHENSPEIWHDLLQKFFEENCVKYPSIFKSPEDFDLKLRIRMEEVDRIIEEKNVNFTVSCWNWRFPCTVHVDGICSSFSLFDLAVFLKSLAFFHFESERVKFVATSFLGGLYMPHHQTCKVKNIKFEDCCFGKSSSFMKQKFESFEMFDSRFGNDVKLIFKIAEFSEKVLLIDRDLNLSTQGLSVCELDLEHAIFDCSLTCSLKLKKCPDFSKSSLLRSKIIEETWQINEQEISHEDKPKFRFLKKYFAEQGNHFKEQEYFSYEMASHEKLLRSRVFSCFEIEKNFYVWFKNISELFLFFVYKWTSNFGMSWVRPLISLLVSAVIMWLYIEKPTQNYFGFLNEFFIFKIDNLSFKEALIKTISPLSTAEEFKDSLCVKIHCLINASLIFLFVLGIRNKFKIK